MKKRIIISIIVLIGLLTTIVSYKYENKETTEVKNELIGVYVSGEKTDKIPSSNEGYILEKYECNDETKIEWDYSTWSVILKDFKKGSSCDYYFVKGKQIKVVIKDEEGNIVDETTIGTTEGKTVKDLEKPEKPGHKFKRWKDKEGNTVDPNTPVEEIDELEAEYETEEYDLTIILNSTSSTSTPNKIKYRGSVELSITPGGNDYYLSEARCSDGYTTSAKVGEDKTGTQEITITNIGVTKSGECTFTSTKKSTPDDPTPSKIKISFDSNGGSTVSDVYERTTEERYGTLPETTKTGYTFEGWYTDTTGGNKITSETMVTNTQNHTLYAHWNANTYTISYDANGGSGAPGNTSCTYDSSCTLASTKPTRENYSFLGWADTSTATSAKYSAGSSVSNLTSTNGGTVTLYAVWSINAATVSISTSNVSSNKSSISVVNGASNSEVVITPNSGYYIYDASCTSGLSVSIPKGVSVSSAQTATITNSGNVTSGTCTFTGELIITYKYWNDNYAGNSYQSTSAPSTLYPNYTSFDNGSPLIKTTYEGTNPQGHSVCLYYNNKLYCLNQGFWQDNGSTEESVTEALRSAMSTAFGKDPSTCATHEAGVGCIFDGKYSCTASPSGAVVCNNNTTGKMCLVSSDVNYHASCS